MIEPVEDRRDGDALAREAVITPSACVQPTRRHSSSTGGRGRWKYRSPPAARRALSSSRQSSAAGRSMKFMFLTLTSRCVAGFWRSSRS
ncbi:MAG: hypothetical protein KGL18_09935 [Burkholderiales bacterium]|nr:hypothetical protein [Burkholderiales bacterium]MDE2503280.1 hypothetical protein [Burkholderiales bacterium]